MVGYIEDNLVTNSWTYKLRQAGKFVVNRVILPVFASKKLSNPYLSVQTDVGFYRDVVVEWHWR